MRALVIASGRLTSAVNPRARTPSPLGRSATGVEDFTPDDLMPVLWIAGTASRDPAAADNWRRVVDRGLAAAWTTQLASARPGVALADPLVQQRRPSRT